MSAGSWLGYLTPKKRTLKGCSSSFEFHIFIIIFNSLLSIFLLFMRRLICFVFFALSSLGLVGQKGGDGWDLSSVKASLIKKNSLGTYEFLSKGISSSITTKQVVVGKNESLSRILSKNGVFPDFNAYMIIKELNPELLGLDLIKPGDVIRIPIVPESVGSATQLDDAFFYLNASRPLADQSISGIDDVRVKLLSTASAGSLELDVSEQLSDIEQLIRVDRGAKSTGYMALLSKDISTLKSAIETGKLSSLTWVESALSDYEQILSSGEFLNNMVVNVINGDSTVKGCRVYAKIAYYFEDDDCSSEPCLVSFNKLSSPAEEYINVAKYKVWAMDGKIGVTDTLEVDMNRSFPNVVKVDLKYLK